MNRKYKISYKNIFENMLFGIDIDKDSIFKAELLSRVLATTNNEILDEDFKFNYICGNSLDDSTMKKIKVKNVDYVIANPPYVRSRNINSEDNFAVFDKTDLSCNATWKLNNNSVYNNILKLESFESKLEDFNIKNGLATLKNDIYFF